MIHSKSESDMTSLTPSSPRSPKRPLYYVQSPSRDSHDGDKSSSSMHATTPTYNSPIDSPSHSSYARHSRESSASRFSGPFRSGSGRKNNRKRSNKGWNVIEEEGDYDELYREKELSRGCLVLIGVFGFVLVFAIFCLIIWGASRPFKPEISVKSMTVHNIYFGEGSDMTGVPTKLLTMNCTVRMSVYNPATFFGIHVTSLSFTLMYSEIIVASGQLKKYYQPRKSRRNVTVNVQGNKVPLYGAGASLATSNENGGVPLKIVFDVHSRGNVVGKLVKSKHRRRVACSVNVDSHSSKPIKFKKDSCTYI